MNTSFAHFDIACSLLRQAWLWYSTDPLRPYETGGF